MRIAIGSDRAGLDLKKRVTVSLVQEHHEVIDVGTDGDETSGDDRVYAEAVAEALREYRAERGIIVCGSGVGASMAANRIPGIRAGLCHDTYSAHEGVEHDDMNVLVLGGRVVGAELAHELIQAFLNARFKGEARPIRHALQAFGQSVWLDYLRRSLIASGELRRMIEEDGVSGVVCSPAILEKAIAGGSEYGDLVGTLEARTLDAKALYEHLAIRDVRAAADVLRSVYKATARRDGYVSLDVSPALAHDTAATTAEARRLVAAVDRRNVMIRIPATAQGIAAMRALVGEGINVNAALLFAADTYEAVVEAYLDGLEDLAGRGGDVGRLASVASVSVGRVDTAIDERIAAALEGSRNADAQRVLHALVGKAGVANARLIFQRHLELFSGPRWEALASRGARTQRVLWTSTGAKNPVYCDVLYVEELIGPGTVITMPSTTFDAFRDHGRPRASLTEDVDAAEETARMLAEAGVSMKDVADELLADGLRVSTDTFDRLLKAVDESRREPPATRLNHFAFALPAPMAAAVKRSLLEWSAEGKVRRLWGGDASLWNGRDEAQSLGWLGIASGRLAHLQRLTRLRTRAQSEAISDVVMLGVGGPILCAEALRLTFGRIDGFPDFHVVDSTDPTELRALDRRVDLRNTLFLVASKSGATVEANILDQHFFERVVAALGRPDAGRRFIAITDPGSPIQQIAERDRFRHVFFGWPTIPARYSALSDFGLVPAVLMGIDIAAFLDRAETMVCACMPPVPAAENPAVVAGTILGVSARHGRDKLTIATSPGLQGFGAWLEELVGESTGKDGRGLIPIDREAIGPSAVYGRDRLFVYLRLASDVDAKQSGEIDALETAGHPVIRIVVDDPYDLGQEFFRWQVAVAVAGAMLEVNPFDQPEVEAGRTAMRRLLAEYEKTGLLPPETPIFTDGDVSVFADPKNAAALAQSVNGAPTLAAYLKAHVRRLRAGDYFALLAFIQRTTDHERILQDIRHRIRHATRSATCLEYGPHFLYSTGQAYKGGPNTGVFLQITSHDGEDAPVPGRRSTFGVIKAAAARGDFQALADRDRRLLRLHFATDSGDGLRAVQAALQTALS